MAQILHNPHEYVQPLAREIAGAGALDPVYWHAIMEWRHTKKVLDCDSVEVLTS